MAMIQQSSVQSPAREHGDFAAVWPVLLFVAVGLALTLLATFAMDWSGVTYDPTMLQEAFP